MCHISVYLQAIYAMVSYSILIFLGGIMFVITVVNFTMHYNTSPAFKGLYS